MNRLEIGQKNTNLINELELANHYLNMSDSMLKLAVEQNPEAYKYTVCSGDLAKDAMAMMERLVYMTPSNEATVNIEFLKYYETMLRHKLNVLNLALKGK